MLGGSIIKEKKRLNYAKCPGTVEACQRRMYGKEYGWLWDSGMMRNDRQNEIPMCERKDDGEWRMKMDMSSKLSR